MEGINPLAFLGVAVIIGMGVFMFRMATNMGVGGARPASIAATLTASAADSSIPNGQTPEGFHTGGTQSFTWLNTLEPSPTPTPSSTRSNTSTPSPTPSLTPTLDQTWLAASWTLTRTPTRVPGVIYCTPTPAADPCMDRWLRNASEADYFNVRGAALTLPPTSTSTNTPSFHTYTPAPTSTPDVPATVVYLETIIAPYTATVPPRIYRR